MDVRFTPTDLRFARSLRDARRHGMRRGVALMVVLGLLSMFVLVAMAFVMTASSHRESAVNASKQELYGDPPDAILNRAMYQIVRGSNNPFSRIGPHSLLEDMYGNRETIMGAVVATVNAQPLESFPRRSQVSTLENDLQRVARGQFVDLKIVSFGADKKPGVANVDDDGNGIADDLADLSVASSGNLPGDDRLLGDSKGQTQLDNVEGFYAGRLLTFLDGPAKNETVRIVRYYDLAQESRLTPDPNNSQPPDFRLLVTRPQNGQPIIRANTDAVRVVINGRPFNGAGFGYAPHPQLAQRNGMLEMTNEILNNPSLLNNASYTPYNNPSNPDSWPFAFRPNPSEAEYQRYLSDAPLNGNAAINPFGVDADEDYDAPDYQNMMLAGAIWSREQGLRSRWVVRVPSLHRPDLVAFHLQGLNSANLPLWLNRHDTTWASVLTGGSATSLAGRLRQKIILRPDPQDHMADGSTTWYPGMVEWSGNPFFHPVMGPWDVDNDGDGINDSIWVDLGSPVQTAENGKRYKSLFAILCLDLDGRFNVNVHGNWTHYTARSHLSPTSEEGYEYGQFEYSGVNGTSGAPGYNLSNDTLQREAWAMDYYILGMRTVGRKYTRGSAGVYRDNQLPTRLFYWGSDNESTIAEGGPYAGAAGTLNNNRFNAHYTGGIAADNAYWGSTTSWTQSGQGFSVAEVNLGGVLPLGLMTYPYNNPSGTPQPPPSKPVNPYRILLEGHPLRTDSGQDFVNRNGEGRYGERATFFAQVNNPLSNPYLGIYNDVSAYFGRMVTDPSSVPGFARPGMTFVDDNSPLPPSMGTGYYTYKNYLSWPSVPITGTGSSPPSIGASSGAGQLWFAPQLHTRVMANHSEYAQLTTRGNRFTDASYTFWGRDNNGSGDQLAIKGVGNYGFHVDPNGHIGLALDFRGIPYANHRALPIPRASTPPSYIGDSLTTPSSGKTANVWVNTGGTVNYAWRRGHKWLHVNESIDDPWELDVYTVPRETRAYTVTGGGAETPLNPLDRDTRWAVATAASRRYPRTGSGGMYVPNDGSDTVAGPPDTFPNPPDVARSATYFVDRPYALSDLEPMIRFGDIDVTEADSRICGVLGRSGILYNIDQLDSIRRWLLTTDSWDVPSPNVSAPPELAYALEALPQIDANLKVNSTNLTFSDLIFAKMLAAKVYTTTSSTNQYYPQPTDYASAGLAPADLQTIRRSVAMATKFGPNQIVPRDLLLGTRMDINRPFGNAMDDDFDGTVDEPPPAGPNLFHRAGPLNPNASNDLQKGFALSTGHFQAAPAPVSGAYSPGELNVMYTDIGNTNQRANSSLDAANDATGAGVAPEASNWQVSTAPYVKRRLANYDANNRVWIPDHLAAEMSRQDLAKHLYILAMLFNEVSWQFPFGGASASGNPADMAGVAGAGDTVLSAGGGGNPDPILLRKMAAYRCAQWAVNVVDFRDRDAIMTPFEFDIQPFVDNDSTPDGSTWDVNGLLENTSTEDGLFPPGMLPNANNPNNSTEDTTSRPTFRGLVWGMEAPELLLTETLAFHDLRVADTDKDTGMGMTKDKKTTDSPPDPTFDQVRVPQGSLFVELYAAGARQAQPNPYHPDLAHFPPELYDIVSNDPLRPEHVPPGNSDPNNKVYNRSVRYGLLDLSRLAPPSVSPSGKRCRMPVWRMALSTWQVQNRTPESPSVNKMIHQASQSSTLQRSPSDYRPYTCDLGPWPLPDRNNTNWQSQLYAWMETPGTSQTTSYMIDKISANLLSTGTPSTGGTPDLITLDRFIWFVDRANLDIQPPENVYCYMNGTGSFSGTGPATNNDPLKPPMRFLLEPGHYAVVGPERLDNQYDTIKAATRRNFITFTARSDIFSSDPGNTDKADPKSISAQPAWYPAWFNLDVELRDPNPTNAATGIPGTVKRIPGYGANVPYKTALAMGDVVNYIRSGGSFAQMTYNYPVMASPYEIWTQSLKPLTNTTDTILPAEIKTPLTIPVAAINNTAQIKQLQPYSGLNISEPIGGYTAQTSTTTPTDVTYRIKDSLDESKHSILQYDLLPIADDQPWDGKTGSSELHGNGQNSMLAPGFYDDVRTVFLQRLANPLVAWHPIYNPYITVDWLPTDLLVYNGESVWQDPSTMMGTPTIQNPPTFAQLDPSGTSTSTPPQQNLMMSRQRGLSAADKRLSGDRMDMHSLWPAYSKVLSITPYAFDYFNAPAFTQGTGAFRHDPVCSLGYLNHFYKVSTATTNATAALPGVDDRLVLDTGGQTVGPLNSVQLTPLTQNAPLVPWFTLIDYIGSPPRPFPWVTWFNRPFANQMELMLVPATSPSKFTAEFTYQTTPRRYTAANAGPLSGLPANAGVDIDFAQPQFFGGQARGDADKHTSRRWPFGHLLNFFASSRPDDPGDPINGASTPASLSRFLARPNFYRILEYVHVGTRFSGSEDFITPFSPWDGGTPTYDPATVVFSPPFNRLPKFREPGRVNLNTFMGANMSRWELTPDMPASEAQSEATVVIPTQDRIRQSLDPSQSISPAQHWGSLVNFTPMHNIHWELFNKSRYAGDLSTWIDINVDKTVNPRATIKSTASPSYISPWVRSATKPQLHNPMRPSIYANPFRSYTNSMRVPYESQRQRKYPDSVVTTDNPGTSLGSRQNPLHRYSDASFLRWDDVGDPRAINGDDPTGNLINGQISNPRAEGMFVTDDFLNFFGPGGRRDDATMNVHHIHDPTRNPYFRYQDYMKLGNVATTHSNVYAVWMTMGKFEVEPVQDQSASLPGYRHPSVIGTSNPDGFRLVRELGSDTGDIRRSRSFMVIDRSVPVGFQRGENFNVDKSIKIRRFIE